MIRKFICYFWKSIVKLKRIHFHEIFARTRKRMHAQSGKMKYLEAAIKALQPFSLLSNKGGVKALFMGKMTWYEEYPTSYVFHKDHITCNQYGLGFGLVLTGVTMKCRPAPVLKLRQSPIGKSGSCKKSKSIDELFLT